MAQFFTDFTEYAADAQPSDWTERWNTADGAANVRDSGIPAGGGVKALEYVTAFGHYALSWDAVGTPSGDVEIVAKIMYEVDDNIREARIGLHGSGVGEAQRTEYLGYIRDDNSSQVGIYNSGSFSTLDSATFSSTGGTWYWIRLQRTGTTVRARFWEDGSAEPGTWNVSGTNSSLSSGHVHLSSRLTGTVWVDRFGVGTSGDAAPTDFLTQEITNSALEVSPTFGGHSLIPGAVSISSSALEATSLLNSHSLVKEQFVSPQAIQTSPAFGSHQINQSLQVSALETSAVLGSHSIEEGIFLPVQAIETTSILGSHALAGPISISALETDAALGGHLLNLHIAIPALLTSQKKIYRASGSYIGNGTSQAITGLGFNPDFVWIRRDNATFSPLVGRSYDMDDGTYGFIGSTSSLYPDASAITSLDADGFSVGNRASVNENGDTYYWVAVKDNASSRFAAGHYEGDDTDNRDINIGFQPDVVFIIRESEVGAGAASYRTSEHVGDSSQNIDSSNFANLIQGFSASGFQVGEFANFVGGTYHWIAFADCERAFDTFSYNGDGDDNRRILGLGFLPIFSYVKSSTSVDPAYRFKDNVGDSSFTLLDSVSLPNYIQAFESDGFEIGTEDEVNANLFAFRGFAIGTERGHTLSIAAALEALQTTPTLGAHIVAGPIGVSAIETSPVFGSHLVFPAQFIEPSALETSATLNGHELTSNVFITPSALITSPILGIHRLLTTLSEPDFWGIVYANDESTIEGVLNKILFGRTFRGVNRIGEFELDLPATDETALLIDVDNYIHLYYGKSANNPRFRGRVSSVSKTVTSQEQKLIKVTGTSLAGELSDAKTYAGVLADDISVSNTMDALQEGTGWTDLTTGIGFQDVSQRFDNMSIWQAMSWLAKHQNAYLRETNTPRQIEIRRGTPASELTLLNSEAFDPSNKHSEDIAYIKSIGAVEKDGSRIVNRVVGKGEDNGNVIFDLGDSSRSSPYTIQTFTKNRPTITNVATFSFSDADVPSVQESRLWRAGNIEVTGKNRAVLVIVNTYSDTNLAFTQNPIVSGITANVSLRSTFTAPSSPLGHLNSHAAKNVPKGLNSIVIPYDRLPGNTEQYYTAVAIALQDVDQRLLTASGVSDTADNGSGTSASLTLAGDDKDIRFSIIGSGTLNWSNTPTSNSGQERLETLVTFSQPDMVIDYTYDENDSSIGWSFGGSEEWGAIAFQIMGARTFYIEDSTSVSSYGGPNGIPRTKILNVPGEKFVGAFDSQLEEVSNMLYDLCNAIVDRNSEPITFYRRIETTEILADDLLPGDSIAVKGVFAVEDEEGNRNTWLSIEDDLIVLSIEESFSPEMPRKWSLNLATEYEWLNQDDSELVELLQKLEALAG